VAATLPATPYNDPQTMERSQPRREPPGRRQTLPWADFVFSVLAHGAAWLTLALLAGIIISLIVGAAPAIKEYGLGFLWSTDWDPVQNKYGGLVMIYGTLMTSLIALVIAVPVSFGIALFLTELSPGWLRRPLGVAIELLAAVPSIVYGVWGLYVLAPALKPFAVWLNESLDWLFLFQTGNVSLAGGGTIFTAGIVLAVMILPIITAVTREVFIQTPRGQIEAALALGATRWEVVKTTVLPFGLSGYISGAMLGLGRALGETIALLIILRGTQTAFGWSLFDGGYTFASKIAATASEFNDQYKAGAYIAAGLVLFILTFVVNSLARAAVAGRGAK